MYGIKLKYDNMMRQSLCLAFNPITVEFYASFFKGTAMGCASDSMMARRKAIFSRLRSRLFCLLLIMVQLMGN